MKLYEHPEYEEIKEDYELWHELYEGDQKELKKSKYLWLHELETKPAGAGIRKLREQRSSYTNWAEVLVSLWTSILMRKDPIIPDEVMTLLGDLIDDVDGEGTSLVSFIRDQIVAHTFIYGKPIVKVDALGEKPNTLAEEEEANYRPFMQIIDPKSFVDWKLEKKDVKNLNKLQFCRLEYCEYSERNDATDPIEEMTISKVYIMREGKLNIDKYKLKEDKKGTKKAGDPEWELIDSIVIPDWDEIPITFSESISWLRDVSPHILKYYNTESVIDNVVLMQGHQRIFVIGDVSQMEVISLSESGLNSLPLGSTIEVIEAGDTAGAERRLQSILGNIIRVGLNQLKMQIEGQAVESADTLQQVKDNTIGLIQAELENVENVINKAIELWAKYKGQDGFKSQIKFNIEDVKDNIDQIVKLIMVFKDDVSRLPMVKEKLINWFINKMDFEDKDELYKEVAEMVQSEDQAVIDSINAKLLGDVANGSEKPQATQKPSK